MKPSGICFDRSFRARSQVIECGRPAIADMVTQRHYLKRWPGVVVRCFCLLFDSSPVGACVYALPPRESDKRYGGKCWELARLWVDDLMPKNTETWFVSQTVKAIKASKCGVRALISYADPSHGHEGVIYRAGNWREDGRTDQERRTPRFDYEATESVETLFGPSEPKKYARRSHVPGMQNVRKIPRVSKHRFVLYLDISA